MVCTFIPSCRARQATQQPIRVLWLNNNLDFPHLARHGDNSAVPLLAPRDRTASNHETETHRY
jgi:hypothetical protein